MVENNQNTKGQTTQSNPKSSLPPLEQGLKGQFANVAPDLKGSFQLSTEDKAKLPKKKWIHYALIFIPLGLLISIMVLLTTLFVNRGEEMTTDQIDQQSAAQDDEVITALPPLPTIKEEDKSKATTLAEYLKSASPERWKDEYIVQIPDSAIAAYQDFLDSSPNDKKDAAVDFYTVLNNPGVEKNDPDFIFFLNDVRLDLEKQVGGPLYY